MTTRQGTFTLNMRQEPGTISVPTTPISREQTIPEYPTEPMPQVRSGTLVSTKSNKANSTHSELKVFINSQPKVALYSDGNMWEAIASSNMDKVKRFAKEDLVTSDGSNLGKRGLCERGSSGETILHLACFRGNKECIRWIAEEFPELINEGHIRKKRYLGETALHLAVVKSEIGDIDIVEFIQ